MSSRARAVVVVAFAAALVVFCIVQDRVTAAGAQQYVTRQRAAVEGRGPAVTLDEIVAPAVRRSVRQAGLYSAVVLAAGLGIAAAANRGRP